MTGQASFSGRRVLVTGHTGFKGSWLSLWLHKLGATVTGYALPPPTTPSMFVAANVASCLADRRGDVRDASAVREAVEAADPEIVFHLAAQAIVREGYNDPVATFGTNVTGTAAVLDACRHSPNVRAIVVVTSDKCYENMNWIWGYRENDRLGGFDPYSSSKACAELVSDAFYRSYFIQRSPSVGLATARAGNVIGGGDWASHRLVPDLARAAMTGSPAIIRYPGAVRPWQHVLDPLAGYLRLAQCLLDDPSRYSGAWNFGPSPDSMASVETIVAKLAARWHGKLKWSVDAAAQAHEAERLLLDSSKAAAGLSWRPRLKLDDALDLTANWYSASGSGETDLLKLSEAQITAYSELPDPC